MALSAATIRSEIRALLNESTAAFYSDAEIDSWASQGAIDVSTKTHCLEATSTITLAADTIEYAAPTNFSNPTPSGTVKLISIRMAYYSLKSLTKIKPESLGRITPDVTSDDPAYYFLFGERVFLSPVGSSASGTVNLLCVVKTDDVTDIPDEWQLSLILYGAYRGKLKDQKYAQASALYAEYINTLGFQRNDLIERIQDTKMQNKIPDDLRTAAA